MTPFSTAYLAVPLWTDQPFNVFPSNNFSQPAAPAVAARAANRIGR